MKNLIEAVLNVMKEVKNIDKNLNVGTGNSSYKGVSDKDVKVIIGNAMQKYGLVIFTTGLQPTTTINTWEEQNNYGGINLKKNVITEVVTNYKLYHKSGESIDLMGYGQGVDAQDKGAGKATTYALKYTLLYNFMVATGSIDDADTTHSNDILTPVKTVFLTKEQYEKALTSDKKGIEATLKAFSTSSKKMSADFKKQLEEKLKTL